VRNNRSGRSHNTASHEQAAAEERHAGGKRHREFSSLETMKFSGRGEQVMQPQPRKQCRPARLAGSRQRWRRRAGPARLSTWR
jgi:hypothetical protein